VQTSELKFLLVRAVVHVSELYDFFLCLIVDRNDFLFLCSAISEWLYAAPLVADEMSFEPCINERRFKVVWSSSDFYPSSVAQARSTFFHRCMFHDPMHPHLAPPSLAYSSSASSVASSTASSSSGSSAFSLQSLPSSSLVSLAGIIAYPNSLRTPALHRYRHCIVLSDSNRQGANKHIHLHSYINFVYLWSSAFDRCKI
jgi:hypothetical protein